jgi:hypothetical protein
LIESDRNPRRKYPRSSKIVVFRKRMVFAEKNTRKKLDEMIRVILSSNFIFPTEKAELLMACPFLSPSDFGLLPFEVVADHFLEVEDKEDLALTIGAFEFKGAGINEVLLIGVFDLTGDWAEEVFGL